MSIEEATTPAPLTDLPSNACDPGVVRGLLDAARDFARSAEVHPQRIKLRSGSNAVELDWSRAGLSEAGGPPQTAVAPAALLVPPALQQETAESAGIEGSGSGIAVESPLVGVFYAAPAPDADPFVSVGDLVDAEQVIGIVEAMKLMNRITAPCRGQVREIAVDNGERVEYGQALLWLEPVEGEDR